MLDNRNAQARRDIAISRQEAMSAKSKDGERLHGSADHDFHLVSDRAYDA